ncbi:hypothetical protein PR048_020134 [Dryococelus australis]|uniref:Uncharacterized protein n=1 Tax=Dryococelus australis TaxID=614101 RepID=A0ABQ9H5F7_9NEOP|nr:hypothetical protein PR048_020134 [Dryococelus australis]
MNNFAVSCSVRKVRMVKTNHSSSESLYCDATKTTNVNEWREHILIKGKVVNIKLSPDSEEKIFYLLVCSVKLINIIRLGQCRSK